MKNMMRRTVAFMLLACLLLSVMAPAASAVAVNEPDATTGAITYSWANTVAGTSLGEVAAGTEYGNFEYLAVHGRVKGSQTLLQTQGSFVQGSFFALEFTVANAGYYDIALDIAEARADVTEIDVHFFPVSAMNAEMTKDERAAAVAANDTPYHVEVANTATRALSRVNFAAAGDYVLVVERTSEAGVNMNFKGFTMTPSNIVTVTTNYSYDFTTLGALLGAPAGNHAGFGYSADAQALFDAGKINYLPYAKRGGGEDGSGGDVYSENGKYGYCIFAQTSGIGGLFALKLPGLKTGTYDFGAVIHNDSSFANATAKGQVYMIPVADVEAALAAAQATNEEATSGDAIYNLIQGTYAGKHIVEASFRNASISGTAKIESDGDYIAVFYAAALRSGTGYTQAQMKLCSMTLTKSASFNSLEAALADTDEFDTVTLLDDVDLDGVLNIGTGATLDLNGNALNGTLNVTDGNLVDSVGTGTVSNVAGLQATNKAVVVKDGATYRTLSYTAKTNGYKVNTETNAIEFWFDADFAEDAYALLTSANGVTLNATLEVKGKQVTVDMTQKINDWVAKKGLTDEGENAGLGIAVTGFETLKAGDTITVTPVFQTTAGNAGVFGSAITYTVPEA